MACNFLCVLARYSAPPPISRHSNLRRFSVVTYSRSIHNYARHPFSLRHFTRHPVATLSFSSLAEQENVDFQLHNEEGQAFESQKKPYFPKKNQVVELVCESLAFKGKGVCKILESGFVVMCDRALPGERFIGRITRVKKGHFAEVKKLKTIVSHSDGVTAPCEHATDCGGCKTQNLAYEAQVRAKEQQVRELMIRIGRFPIQGHGCEDYMKPIVTCDVQLHYRNKMEFSFGAKSWVPENTVNVEDGSEINKPALGLHVPGRFDKILPIKNCLLQHKVANQVLAIVQEGWQDPMSHLSPYDVHKHIGFLKHLTLRTGRDYDTGLLQVMVNFVTSCHKPKLLQPIVLKIVDAIPEVADVLYSLVEEAACLRGDSSETVMDLFCGTGTIGLTLAKKVKYVYGYEVVPQAVADACRNAARNDIQNAKFIQGDLNKVGDDFGNEFPHPDIVVTDPNRPGMHKKLILFLLKLRAQRIIYVSCNPATCARDLDYLCHGLPESKMEGAYRLKSVQPVDMFPHTPHIECVCLLELS